jgi:hypothetical protein
MYLQLSVLPKQFTCIPNFRKWFFYHSTHIISNIGGGGGGGGGADLSVPKLLIGYIKITYTKVRYWLRIWSYTVTC